MQSFQYIVVPVLAVDILVVVVAAAVVFAVLVVAVAVVSFHVVCYFSYFLCSHDFVSVVCITLLVFLCFFELVRARCAVTGIGYAPEVGEPIEDDITQAYWNLQQDVLLGSTRCQDVAWISITLHYFSVLIYVFYRFVL